MQFNLSTTLTDPLSKEVLRADGKELTAATAIAFFIGQQSPQDNPTDKWDLFLVYRKVAETPANVQLSAEEVALIKRKVGEVAPVLHTGLIFEALDNPTPKTGPA